MSWDASTRRTELPSNWRTIRAAILYRDPMCGLGLDGCTRISTEVDHIRDKHDHSLGNLRGLCHKCHAKRTARQAADAKKRARRKPESHPGLA